MRRKAKLPVLVRIMTVAALVLTLFPTYTDSYAAPAAPTTAAPAAAPAAPGTNFHINLKVVSARTESRWPGDGSNIGVTEGETVLGKAMEAGANPARVTYKYIINQDNVGDVTQPRSGACSPVNGGTVNINYPDGCNWPSIKAMRASAPIVTQGTDADLNQTTGFDLPTGNYLISVEADGFKIDGLHFSIPRVETTPLVVAAQPHPLPLGTIRIQVFEDNATTNSAWDVPGEDPLVGFEGHLNDVLGEVTTDWYGNPLCTQYQKNPNGTTYIDPTTNKPVITVVGGRCLSGPDGQVVIPNIGPDRYTSTVTPPTGSQVWVQTTTLEGNHDYDIWTQEGATGYDTEFTNPTAEASPPTVFGFVKPLNLFTNTSVTGSIKGTVWATKTYFPQNGGLPYNGTSYTGGSGTKLDKVINKPWVSLNDLGNGDQAVYVAQGNTDGTFNISHVPNGDYSLAYWDAEQEYILEVRNVSVRNGAVTDLGNVYLAGWWADYHGRVCIDNNNNGQCESTEPGLKNQPVTLKTRSNSVMERGSTSVVTDNNGYYSLRETYPLTSWIVMEVFNQRYYTTGVTFQADNQPNPTFIPGNGVDVSIFPIIGLGASVDWAVRPYAAGTNGGIVGTVTYDTTRNELDPRFAATETYQPGIPGLQLKLYQPIACGTNAGATCDPDGIYELAADGSYKTGPLLNTYESEEWARPTDCTARDVNMQPLPVADLGLPLPHNAAGKECVEAPMMGSQIQQGFSTVDGNYGFTTIKQYDTNGNEIPGTEVNMPSGDYLVKVEIPNDFRGKPLYQVTREEDVNVFKGDAFAPQEPPPPCAGALHTVEVTSSSFLDGGGSPYEGMQRPLCDMKLISVKNGRSIAPNFNFFTEVPLPGRWNGYIVDDLNLSTNPQDTLFGEKRGLPNSPIGIYDFNNRLVYTTQSDPNGLFEVLMPSTSTYNCPLPAGPCPGVYRLVGNDPGVPNKLNPTYDPQYRTISASFEIWPGLIIPADLAPTRIGNINTQGGGSQFNVPNMCSLDNNTPQIFSVDKVYIQAFEPTNAGRTITINGRGFGATQGTRRVTMSASGYNYGPYNSTLTVVAGSWSDTQIKVIVPLNAPSAPYQLNITNNGAPAIPLNVSGITLHIVAPGGYNPVLYEVGQGKPYSVIQTAMNAASNSSTARSRGGLVVVYPGAQTNFNPYGVYYENLVMYSPLKLQGVGPGGFKPDGTYVRGTIIDGLGWAQVNLAAWSQLVSTLTWSGNQTVYEGAVITVFARDNQFARRVSGQWVSDFPAGIDGFTIQGGDQLGIPNRVNSQPNGGTVITQGGGIFVNGYARAMVITNNSIKSNGGSYGGGIRLGTAYVGDNHNDNIRISQNRIVANGGTNLAGGVGIFSGAHNYEIDRNDLCGNYSAEYGGGISQYGRSDNGKIHNNRIYYNSSFDEGGGIMIAGELQANVNALSPGAGPVDIYNNLIENNLSNDDGGGIRFLMAGNYAYNVYSNIIVNNVSTHEGGGIALDDAPNVRVFNNTIMKNITTATAATSNGQPAPAGLSTGANSIQLQATLPAGSSTYSRPLLFNNIFWDNRAGTFDWGTGPNAGKVTGIGIGGAADISTWDIGAADGTALDISYSIIQTNRGVAASSQNATPTTGARNLFGTDPLVKTPYNTQVTILPWRTNPYFIGTSIVAVNLPIDQVSDYHLQSTSPAINKGIGTVSGVSAPTTDIDAQTRSGVVDMGADEYRP